jgi:hypothetical protein
MFAPGDRMSVGLPAEGRTCRPGQMIHLDANSPEHQPSRSWLALAPDKQPRRPGARTLRELRDTILGLLREPDETVCAECVATALGQQVRVVTMIMLGLRDRVASFQGVCSTCHRHARVIRRATHLPG